MKYILKYKTKSKYFGFIREGYKEFDKLFQVFNYITNNSLYEWQIYEKQRIAFSEMVKEKK